MPIDAKILIVARDDALAGPLSEGLDRLGWRTITARGPYSAQAAMADLALEAAIIDASLDEPDVLARRLRATCASRRLPVVALGEPAANIPRETFDLILPGPPHATQLAIRLESLVRSAVAAEEFELRAETFAERGMKLDPPSPDPSAMRILAIGEPTPQFLALSNTLSDMGAEVVGAFTAFTAFDYLHERPFDVVVAWTGEEKGEALSIVSGMRRNTRLYHIPALLHLTQGSFITPAEAFQRGVSDVASAETPEAETAARVLALGEAFRGQEAVRKALEKARRSGLMDASTGLFARDLFASHLIRLARAARARKRPLSVAVLRLAERKDLAEARAGGWLERAIPQIGSMIGRLVRVEDVAARLGPETFALALPATGAAAAKAAAERIAAVLACTAFDAGEGRAPFVVEFDIGVAQMEGGDGAVRALELAAQRSQKRGTG